MDFEAREIEQKEAKEEKERKEKEQKNIESIGHRLLRAATQKGKQKIKHHAKTMYRLHSNNLTSLGSCMQ